jgi:hypothetical protein
LKPRLERHIWLSLFLLSGATLAFEIDLTRLFSVAQFYHFAFMIVSIALLGVGASGTALVVFPSLRSGDLSRRLSQLAAATAVSGLAAFLLINWLPFDSFSIAWERGQALILILHYVALAAPFLFSSMALGLLLGAFPEAAGTSYGVNMLGSAAGCLIALVAPSSLGGEGLLTLCIGLASAAAIILALGARPIPRLILRIALVLVAFVLLDLGLRFTGRTPLAFLRLRISPYKSLSYALHYPDALVISSQWNAFSRVDVVHSAGIHSVPGLSYRYLDPIPRMDGLFVDGDDLSPVVLPGANVEFVNYLPASVVFRLRPNANALVLEPRGGLDLLAALALTSGTVTAVELNPLVVVAAPIYQDQRAQIVQESERTYLRGTHQQYDVIIKSLASSFHPVRSGAYSLAEDYRYTVESFEDVLARLNRGGLFVSTRWLQDPPSEDLRLFALAVTAIDDMKGDPSAQVVAFRGFNTATVLLKNGAFSSDELSSIRDFLASRAFDLSYAPDIRSEESNRYNVLPQSTYYNAYMTYLNSPSSEMFYREYPYDVRPPTDDHPFFGHYFKWNQASQVLAEFGKTWQPFGGAGYFVILALLALACLLAGVLMLLPVSFRIWTKRGVRQPVPLRQFLYFGLLGFAFLFVEIPLLQHFILYVGSPAYAVTMVLFSLLCFSGLGSRWSSAVPLRPCLLVLPIVILALPLYLPAAFNATLGAPLLVRLGLTPLVLAPLGFLMGVPFPSGIRLLIAQPGSASEEDAGQPTIPWIWAANGAASVIAAILAALLALTLGFNWVLRLGALCYAGAWITVLAPSAARRRDR